MVTRILLVLEKELFSLSSPPRPSNNYKYYFAIHPILILSLGATFLVDLSFLPSGGVPRPCFVPLVARRCLLLQPSSGSNTRAP